MPTTAGTEVGGPEVSGMRVLLVQPRQPRRAGFRAGFRAMALVEPLGLEMIAATVGAEHEVRVLDLLGKVDLEREMEGFAPDVCGISCSFTVDVPLTVRIAESVKHQCPGAFVLVGGHHASLNPGDFAVPSVDAVMVGEGEAAFPKVVAALAAGTELSAVAGLMLNTEAGQVGTGVQPLTHDLDLLPMPERAPVRRWRRRYHLGTRSSLYALETARGCPYRCTFCSVWRFYRGKVRFKSPERVLAEIESIPGKNILITDDNFLASVPRADRIADLLLEKNLKKRFIFQARTDSIARHPEVVAKLRQAGFATVFLGLEKIDAEGMEGIHKGNTVESNETALKVLKDVGINTFGTLIVDPDYDEDDFKRLWDYVRRRAIPNAWFTILTPLPGTELFDQVKEKLTTRNWEIFDLAHAVLPTRLGLDEFYRHYAHLYTAVYSPRVLAGRMWNAMFNRQGRSIGGVPSLSLAWRSLNTLRSMSDPDEYMLGHVEESEVPGSELSLLRG